MTTNWHFTAVCFWSVSCGLEKQGKGRWERLTPGAKCGHILFFYAVPLEQTARSLRQIIINLRINAVKFTPR